MNKVVLSIKKNLLSKEELKKKIDIKIKEEKKITYNYKYSLLAIVFIISFITYYMPVGYVNVKLDSNILMSTNIFDVVINVEALENDNYNHYNYQSIDKVIENINHNNTVINVYSDNDEICNRLNNKINQKLNDRGVKKIANDINLDENDYKKINTYKVNENKYKLIKYAMSLDNSLKFEELITLKGKEISVLIKKLSK